MNEYQLIEFTSKKKVMKMSSKQSKLKEFLSEVYKNKMDILFDKQGKSRGFISIFVNSQQLFSIQDINLNNHDEIQIITSISGG